MTHQVVIDLSTRSTPAIVAKLRAAQENGEREMEAACIAELDRRGEHPDGDPSAKDD